jgi:hypothetical protein
MIDELPVVKRSYMLQTPEGIPAGPKTLFAFSLVCC